MQQLRLRKWAENNSARGGVATVAVAVAVAKNVVVMVSTCWRHAQLTIQRSFVNGSNRDQASDEPVNTTSKPRYPRRPRYARRNGIGKVENDEFAKKVTSIIYC